MTFSPSGAMAALLPPKHLERLRIMQPLMWDIFRRQRYALAAFVLFCMWFPVTDLRFFLRMLMLCAIATIAGTYEYNPRSIETQIPVRRLDHMRCLWAAGVAIPLAAMALVFAFALALGPADYLRDFIAISGINSIAVSMVFIGALPPYSTKPPAGRAHSFTYPVLGSFAMIIAAIQIEPAPQSNLVLTLIVLCGFVCVLQSYRSCRLAVSAGSHPVAGRPVSPRSVTPPRIIPKWRGALIPVEGAMWLAASLLAMGSVLIFPFMHDGRRLDVRFMIALLVGGVFVSVLRPMGETNSHACRFIRTLPIPHSRRFLIHWFQPTIIGLALGALMYAGYGGSGVAGLIIMACFAVAWCWIWFAAFYGVFSDEYDVDWWLGLVVPVLFFISIASLFALCGAAVALSTNATGGAVAFLFMLFVLFVCETAADFRGVTRQPPARITETRRQAMRAAFYTPRLLVKRLIAVCMIGLLALLAFGPKHTAPSKPETPLAAPATETSK